MTDVRSRVGAPIEDDFRSPRGTPLYVDTTDGDERFYIVNEAGEIVDMSNIGFRDGPAIDAGGRLRTSHAQTLFDSQLEYTAQPLIWESVISGTGTATHSAIGNKLTLATGGTASGARAMRRTFVYQRYQPGKSHLVKLTGVPHSAGTHSGASEARAGYFDDNDGFYFRVSASGNAWVRRASVSGSVVDTAIAQADWNLDKLNGAGGSANLSGLTLDATKEHIVTIDMEALYVGRVRVGFRINGKTIYCHEFLHANATTEPFIRSANLPLCYEVVNNGGTGANVSMTQTCGSIESEGGVNDEGGYIFTASLAGTTVSCANTVALTPIMTIRLVDTFNGIRYRGHVHQLAIEWLNTSANSAYFEMIWNATTLTGATFANSVDATNSGVQFDTAATVVSGGVRIDSGYISSGKGTTNIAATAQIINRMLLARTYAAGLPTSGGGTRDTITLAARGIDGAATLAASIKFEEQY